MFDMVLTKLTNIENMLTNYHTGPTATPTQPTLTPKMGISTVANIEGVTVKKELHSSPADYNRLVLLTSSDEEVIRD